MTNIIKDEFVRFKATGYKDFESIPKVSFYNANANGSHVDNFMTINEVQDLISLLGAAIHEATWAEQIVFDGPVSE